MRARFLPAANVAAKFYASRNKFIISAETMRNKLLPRISSKSRVPFSYIRFSFMRALCFLFLSLCNVYCTHTSRFYFNYGCDKFSPLNRSAFLLSSFTCPSTLCELYFLRKLQRDIPCCARRFARRSFRATLRDALCRPRNVRVTSHTTRKKKKKPETRFPHLPRLFSARPVVFSFFIYIFFF